MDDESCEVHLEEDKVVPETKKRRLKTPFQLKSLENFYNEHKYPSEALKAEVAQELGLTEKQVSGWFCHRRLKDKRLSKDEACGNGRQDLSSGVIQDRGSGLKQDSCSSNKQGHYRYSDLREVESRRFDDTDYPAPDLAYENKSKSVTIGNYRGMENTSSGSSSTSQERLLPQSQNPYDMESLRYSSRSNNNKLMVPDGANNKGNMMASGYLHLQDEIANAAITAVKRQLGREFREDGPPLGTEFQPLPPDAFDSPIREPVNRKTEQYHAGDHILPTCHGVSKVRKEPSVERGYPRFNPGTYPQGSYPERGNIKRTTGETVHRECTGYPIMRKSSLTNYYNRSPVGNSALDNMDGRSVGGESVFNGNVNGNVNHFMRSKYGSVKGVRSDSIIDHRPPPNLGKAFTGESSHALLYNYDDARPHMIQRREYMEAKPSHSVQKIESLDTMDRMAKDKNLQREKRINKESGNPLRVKKHLKNGARVGKRLRGDELMPQDYVLKTPYPEDLLPGRSQIKEPFGDIRTSLSEDETAATDSSIE